MRNMHLVEKVALAFVIVVSVGTGIVLLLASGHVGF